MLVISRTKKILMVIELTVPWEERLQEAHEIKFLKYDPLILEATRKGWKASCLPIEVGCRGFSTKSLSALLRRVGMFGKKAKDATNLITKEAEKCSRWLFIKRDQPWLPKSSQP